MPRCFWFLVALAAAPAGHADAATAGGPADAIAAARATENADGPALLPMLDARARELGRAGDLDKAVSLRRRALRTALTASGNASPPAARALLELARAYIDCRRWLDAEPLLILAARLAPEAQKDQTKAAIFAGLARVALARGDADAALAWAGRAVERARHDPRDASTEPLRAFGAALAARGRFEEARRALDKALARDRERRGADAEETARSLSQLGNLYLRWGRPELALAPLQEATAIDQMRLGPGHPFIADDLHDLGLAYEALSRDEQARRFLLAALAVLEHGPGSKTGSEASRDTPRFAYTELALSRVARRLGDVPTAETAFRDARRILDASEDEERRRERRA